MSLSGLSPENAWLISDDARIVDGVVTITGEALNTILNNLRAEGVAALQQAGELFAENAKKSEQAGEPVAWSRDEIARAVQAEGRTIAAQALLELGWHYQDDPDGISPAAYHIADAILSLPQQTALVGDLTPNIPPDTNNTKESS